ncbi:DUF4389 domain-containing protein [Streptomyces sp. enrichment culture]|uniref:DUF4389 domain-containing protein n=1 Tax=Streptomyces sp. enrichment culture TaxID=1795815 RepID=UPI003F561792
MRWTISLPQWGLRDRSAARRARRPAPGPPRPCGTAPRFHPARLAAEVDAPLSPWLWLVKWLPAVPRYPVLGFFLGGARMAWFPGGLIGLLALFVGNALAFTGRCPRGLFDLLLGLNRWVLRVAAYAALLTDVHPPFRLDPGGREPDALPDR